MKERYFSPATLEQKAQEMRQELATQVRLHPLTLQPERCALLVLDMQSFFLEPSSHAYIPSAQAIVPGLQRLVKAYATRGLPVIFTRHVNTPENAGRMAGWWKDLIAPGKPLSQIIPELDTATGVVLQKSQYDAFHHTELEYMLYSRNVRQVVIGGVMTHLCCESTTRAAFVRGFEVVFLIDGTATYHEDFHRATLLNMAHGFATLALSEEILQAVGAV